MYASGKTGSFKLMAKYFDLRVKVTVFQTESLDMFVSLRIISVVRLVAIP